MASLNDQIRQELRAAIDTVSRRDELLSSDRLQASYNAFRERFGPDKLESLDGEALLQSMHTHGNRESLVYWLEFKNDEEFPGPLFGSISGGSAHKFGLFRRKGSGQWVKGSPQSEENITERQAIVVARNHRSQLLAGIALLEKLPINADDSQYQRLQKDLDDVASDISNLAWSHKYFSLLYPDKLDDFHNQRWQRYNLIKVLQLPPEEEGLYTCAGRFVDLATQLDVPMNHLTSALNERNGRPIRYWRIGTRLEATDNIWPAMRDGGFAAIGWDALGDLSDALASKDDLKESIRKRVALHYPNDAKTLSRKAGEIRNFVKGIEEGDVVVASDGQNVVGLGRVTGPYRHDNSQPVGAPHRRPVDWISTSSWPMPMPEGLRTTVFPIARHEQNLLEIEKRLREKSGVTAPPSGQTAVGRHSRLEGIPGKVQAILDRKGQAILYGPPGTGKTYWARETAHELSALHTFRRPFSELSPDQKGEVAGSAAMSGLVRYCTFHPAYGYEDFLEGFRPLASDAGHLGFKLRDGIFKRICIDARKNPKAKYFLLIDEINRGDIPRIFGELLTLLELDKRGHSTTLPISGDSFEVPKNLYVIGTMNTADRSIALLDTALRRRFGFVELMPDTPMFGTSSIGESIPLGPWLAALNDRIRSHLGRDARNLQIGHAYLLEDGKPVRDFLSFSRILAEDIIPLLEEYCYEDYSKLTQILGAGLVDESSQRVRLELFGSSRQSDLVQALLAPAPEIVTSPDAIVADVDSNEIDETEPDSSDK